MIASTHLAVGAATGLVAQRFFPSNSNKEPVLKRLFFGFVAGYASHLVLDAFPHQEYGINGTALGVILFVEIVAVFAMFFSGRQSSLANAIIFSGMVGGAMPDFLGMVYGDFLSWSQPDDFESMVHLFLHGKIPIGFKVSVYVQIFTALASFVWVRYKLAK